MFPATQINSRMADVKLLVPGSGGSEMTKGF